MSLTVLGEGRGFRVVWLLEEMGLACLLLHRKRRSMMWGDRCSGYWF